jgi:hypothetical protein
VYQSLLVVVFHFTGIVGQCTSHYWWLCGCVSLHWYRGSVYQSLLVVVWVCFTSLVSWVSVPVTIGGCVGVFHCTGIVGQCTSHYWLLCGCVSLHWYRGSVYQSLLVVVWVCFTALVSRVSVPVTVGGGFTALCSGCSVHDTNSKGFVLLSLHSNSLLSSNWIASTLSCCLDRPLLMPLSEPYNFCRNHFHAEVSMEVSIPDITRCISDIPEYFVMESLCYSNVARSRASP